MKPDVKAVYDSFSDTQLTALLAIRELILNTANTLPQIGELEESLKWQQPTYSTKLKTGTPIRLFTFGDKIALFVHCQTTLVEQIKPLFSDVFEFSGTRAVIIDPNLPLPTKELIFFIQSALTYHLSKDKKQLFS